MKKNNSQSELLTLIETQQLLMSSNTLLRLCKEEHTFGIIPTKWGIGLPQTEKNKKAEVLLYGKKIKPSFLSRHSVVYFEKSTVQKLIKQYQIKEGDKEESLLIKKY